MASTLFMNYGTKVRSIIGHLSPLSQQINASVIFQPNYQSFQKAVIVHNFSTTSSSFSNENNNTINDDQINTTSTVKSTYKSHAIKSVPDSEIKKIDFYLSIK